MRKINSIFFVLFNLIECSYISKFNQGKLANSKLEKKASSTRVKGVKRKFDPLVSSDGTEKARNLKVLENMLNKAPRLELSNKVVGKQVWSLTKNPGLLFKH